MAETRKLGASAKPAGNRGKGRPKGVPNKVTGDLKAMILGALSNKGGIAYLERQADENPTAFMTLVGKVLPMTVAGDPDAPMVHEIVCRVVHPNS